MCHFSRTGDAGFVSYRDPHLKRTLEAYEQAADYLEHLELDFDHYQAAVEERQEELADTQTEAMASIIAEQTEAYILDKAGELGLEVTVRVETRTEGNGIPVPWSAELTGSWSQALASALETELGIPAERQVWHEREAEN